jgi:hypothetical protein
MSNKTTIFYSIIIGFIFGLFSSIPVIGFPTLSSFTEKLIFWNIYLATYLIKIGLLPGCENCELAILAYIAVYSFIIGWIGYSIFVFFIISAFDKLKNKKQLLF